MLLAGASPWRGSKEKSMHRFALLPWGDENWVPPAGRVRAGAGWGFAVVRVAVAGRKVHSGGGVPPVVTVHAWTVRGRK
jgi:hypothetical protein